MLPFKEKPSPLIKFPALYMMFKSPKANHLWTGVSYYKLLLLDTIIPFRLYLLQSALLLLLIGGCSINSYAQLIEHEAQAEFRYGLNLPWHEYGWDFGSHPLWGVSYQPNYFEEKLAMLQQHGVNTIRIWVHCDGRASPEFDNNGYVTGLDDLFLTHLSDFLERAQNHHINVLLCLWSFEMTADDVEDAGPFAGNHADLLREPDKIESYIQEALIPLVTHFRHQSNILGWEIINEPEWAMDIGTKELTSQVSAETMQRFVGKCAEAIHQASNYRHKVTVGAQSLEWNTDIEGRRVVKNYWSADSFETVGLDPKEAYLDFYSIHYYDWMRNAITPYHHDITHWQLDRPVLISEAPALCKDTDWSVYQQLHHALHRGYAGVLFWSYEAEDGSGNWDCMAEDLHYFSEMNPIRITETAFKSQFFYYPNPVTTSHLNLTFDYERLNDVHIRLFSVTGQAFYNKTLPLVEQGDQLKLPLGHIPSGMYILELNNELYFARQKLVVP